MISAMNPNLQTERELQLTRALRNVDPEAEVSIDHATGQLSISTVLGEGEVMELLAGLGVDAAPVPAAHGEGGGCCGGCGG